MENPKREPRCPECDSSMVVGHIRLGVWDGVLAWECLDCWHSWPRFQDGSSLNAEGARLVSLIRARRGVG